MLDIDLHDVAVRLPGADRSFDFTLKIDAGSHLALAGESGGGKTTLLRLVSGSLPPSSGTIRIGGRDATRLGASRRPILFAGAAPAAPARWSVRHLLVAASHRRGSDREGRARMIDTAVDAWDLGDLLERKLRTLSGGELLRAHLAEIELLRPAILLVERLFASADAGDRARLAHRFHIALRTIGTTLVSEVSTTDELRWADAVAIVAGGSIAQHAPPDVVFDRPGSIAAARATGLANIIPARISGRRVSCEIGEWEIEEPPFEGEGVVVARPGDFEFAPGREESDLLFTPEQVVVSGDGKIVRGRAGGGTALVVRQGAGAAERGRPLPLRFDPSRFTLVRERVPEAIAPFAMPSIADSR